MSDYIERSVVERLLTIAAAEDGDKKCRTWARAICVLHDAPAADVAPVRHERWRYKRTTDDGFAIVECTGCGDEAFAIAYTVTSRSFCPNCSAKMDGGDDDATDHV